MSLRSDLMRLRKLKLKTYTNEKLLPTANRKGINLFRIHEFRRIDEANDYHIHDESEALPKDSKLTFALAGNQNCGKTTLFNQLTGANQHVGNFPGVTVDRKDGTIKNHPEATVTDLPGIYSLSPYSSEEIVTRDFLIKDKPSGIINIVDASNLERNLCLNCRAAYGTWYSMVLALNMMDEVRAFQWKYQSKRA